VCGGQARLAGMELEQTSTILGILADNGIKGSEGGTALRNLLKNIYTPTSQASKAMQALGIQTADTDGNLRDVQDILIDTMSALENLSEADRMTAMGDIFDVRTIAAASATLNNSSERYDELYGKIMDCNGAMEQMAETQNDNLEGDIYSLKSAFEAVGVSVYENLTLSLRNAVQLGTSYLRQLNDSFKKNGFDGLANSLGDELGDAITKISAKIPDFINIGSDIVKSFMQGISNNSAVLAKSASEIVTSLANGVLDLFPMFITVGGQLVCDFADGISEKLPVLTEKAVNIIEWLYSGLIENLPKIIDTALQLVTDFGDKLSENSEKIVSAGVEIVGILADGIKKGIPKVIKTAKQVIKDFANALEKEVPALKPFAEAVKFVADNFEFLASVAVGVWTAFKGYTIILKVSKAVSLLGDAVKIAGLAMTAHPLGLALMGIAGIATALISLDSMAGDYETNLDKAIKKEQEYIDKIDERQKNYQDLRENAQNTADKNFAPVERVSELAKELDNLADASGSVRDEDVERVNAILQTMNDVLGTDYTLVDNQIQ
ncbi:MAG: phage tail tape measure protein, partial [Ruminococcus sp.]